MLVTRWLKPFQSECPFMAIDYTNKIYRPSCLPVDFSGIESNPEKGMTTRNLILRVGQHCGESFEYESYYFAMIKSNV